MICPVACGFETRQPFLNINANKQLANNLRGIAMDIFLINKENPDAVSLAMKLKDAKPGSLLMCTEAEILAKATGDVEKIYIDNHPSPSDLLEINGALFGAMCSFVMEHAKDIEDDINDFGTLKPIWESMNRNCNGID